MKQLIFMTILINATITYGQPSRSTFPQTLHGREQIDSAQKKDINDRILSRKIDFISRNLKFSAEEKTKFISIYRENQKELKELREKQREQTKKLKLDSIELANKKLFPLADSDLALKEEELKLFKKYHEKYRATMHPLKLAKLYLTEEKFTEDQLFKTIMKEEKREERERERERNRTNFNNGGGNNNPPNPQN